MARKRKDPKTGTGKKPKGSGRRLYTDFVSLRGRGREFTVNVVSNTTGTAWRLGTQRFDIQPDGRR